MTLLLEAWAASDPGLAREDNEDAYLADLNLGLFVVCDGLGGHLAGGVASSEAITAVHRYLTRNLDEISAIERSVDQDRDARRRLGAILEHAVQAASDRLYQMAATDPRLKGMGTTMSLVLFEGNRAFVAHVGDSRIYVLRGGRLGRITDDHTVLAELERRRGKISDETLERRPYRNSLSRAVGTQATVKVDTFDMEALTGDLFLMCTDGLYEYAGDDATIEALVTQGPIERAPERLVDAANLHGGRDDATAMVVRVVRREDALDEVELLERHRLGLDSLGAIRLFQRLTFPELIRVLDTAQSVELPRGAEVFREGDEGDGLYIITKGRGLVYKGDLEVAELTKGDHFGEMALVDSSSRSATVVAASDIEALFLSRADFFSLLRSDAVMANKILWNVVQAMSERLREASEELERLRSGHRA